MQLIDEALSEISEKLRQSYQKELSAIRRRCGELMRMHPGQKRLFDAYLRTEEEEYQFLESGMIGSTMFFGWR